MSNTRTVVVPSIPANGTSPIWNSATQEYENQVVGGAVHAVQLAGTSINAVATNLDTDLEANSVYIFQIDLVGKRTVPSASNAARASILQVVTGPSSITLISTEFILTEDPSLFNGWSIAFSNPAGLTFRTALTSLVTETVVFVENIRQVKNPTFNLPPPLIGSYVPTTRQLIAGTGITVNGGGSASLAGDVTIASTATSAPNAEIVFVGSLVSTNLATFDRAGARKLDMTPYPATSGALTRTVKFIADVQKTAGATSVEVQLYDVTHAVQVSALLYATDAALTELQSAALTVGAGAGNIRNDVATMYEVSVRMNGGGLLDQVFVTNARLQISYA